MGIADGHPVFRIRLPGGMRTAIPPMDARGDDVPPLTLDFERRPFSPDSIVDVAHHLRCRRLHQQAVGDGDGPIPVSDAVADGSLRHGDDPAVSRPRCPPEAAPEPWFTPISGKAGGVLIRTMSVETVRNTTSAPGTSLPVRASPPASGQGRRVHVRAGPQIVPRESWRPCRRQQPTGSQRFKETGRLRPPPSRALDRQPSSGDILGFPLFPDFGP